MMGYGSRRSDRIPFPLLDGNGSHSCHLLIANAEAAFIRGDSGNAWTGKSIGRVAELDTRSHNPLPTRPPRAVTMSNEAKAGKSGHDARNLTGRRPAGIAAITLSFD